jgi:hypothetical protein
MSAARREARLVEGIDPDALLAEAREALVAAPLLRCFAALLDA